MSKSLNNTIYLSDSKEEVERKVKSMYTDPKRIHPTDPGTAEGNPVFIYLDAFAAEKDKAQIAEYKTRYQKGTVGDVEVKEFLVRVLNEFLEPIRQRRAKYEAQPDLLKSILESGNVKVRQEANKTLQELKDKLAFAL
jgi:tryptophanyl-tRNA synthetase